jgi:hypothetical protein
VLLATGHVMKTLLASCMQSLWTKDRLEVGSKTTQRAVINFLHTSVFDVAGRRSVGIHLPSAQERAPYYVGHPQFSMRGPQLHIVCTLPR